MRVLHTSDLHGRYHLMFEHTDDFDVWLDTGDFFPDGPEPGVKSYQDKWFAYKQLRNRVRDWLAGRPAVLGTGNHDFASLYTLLGSAIPHMYRTGHREPPLVLGGLTWAGFGQIPWVGNPRIRWADEVHDILPFVSKALEKNPDVLVTHAPPFGVLDRTEGNEHIGMAFLGGQLSYTEHKIRYNFFGHCHHNGGKTEELGTTLFINGATRAIVHEVK